MERYSLLDNLIVRKEQFGCLVFNPKGGQYWQFNKDAYKILKNLLKPISTVEIQNLLAKGDLFINKKDLENFIKKYQGEGLIKEGSSSKNIMIFYDHKKSFRKNRLVSPSSATIYITDFCTKKCKHCAVTSGPKKSFSEEYTTREWFPIIDKLRKIGVLSLVFSGGEPLASPIIHEVMSYADSLQFGLTLLTDYDFITEKDLFRLSQLKYLNSIQTSLDGASASTHNMLRGKGSFGKTLRRLKLLANSGLNYTVSTCVHKNNLNELDKIAEIAQKFKASDIYLNPLSPYGRTSNKNLKKYLLENDDLIQLAQTYLKRAQEGIFAIRNPFWRAEIAHLGDGSYNPLGGTPTMVSLGTFNFSISSKGECYLDSKMKSQKLLYMGNAFEEDLLKVWNNPKLNRLRNFYSPDKYCYIDQSSLI